MVKNFFEKINCWKKLFEKKNCKEEKKNCLKKYFFEKEM